MPSLHRLLEVLTELENLCEAKTKARKAVTSGVHPDALQMARRIGHLAGVGEAHSTKYYFHDTLRHHATSPQEADHHEDQMVVSQAAGEALRNRAAKMGREYEARFPNSPPHDQLPAFLKARNRSETKTRKQLGIDKRLERRIQDLKPKDNRR